MIDPMDLVRVLHRAINMSDVAAVAACYHADAIVEHAFGGDAVCLGADRIRRAWAEEFTRWTGAHAAGARLTAHRIAGHEAGWGWVRADWRRARRSAADDQVVEDAGYSDFWIEDGLIKRHRDILTVAPSSAHLAIAHLSTHTLTDSPIDPVPPSTRSYPRRPIVGVGAVVLVDGAVVLVKRRYEPLAGQWSLPGGGLEVGETLEAGVVREMREEIGLDVEVGPVVDVFDRILLDDGGAVRYHFVLVDYLCRPRGGTLAAGGDVDDVVLAAPEALDAYRLTEKARVVIDRARVLDKEWHA